MPGCERTAAGVGRDFGFRDGQTRHDERSVKSRWRHQRSQDERQIGRRGVDSIAEEGWLRSDGLHRLLFLGVDSLLVFSAADIYAPLPMRLFVCGSRQRLYLAVDDDVIQWRINLGSLRAGVIWRKLKLLKSKASDKLAKIVVIKFGEI